MDLGFEKDLGVYIHFPFCIKKCSYCDFFSLPISSSEMVDKYVDSLLTEIKMQSSIFKDQQIQTVYFGGGTPSLLGGKQFSSIMNVIADNFKLVDNIQVSMEANPATITENKLRAYLDAGLNRISLGVQSFSDIELKLLTRTHDVKQTYMTIDLIHKLGLDNLNLDLIYGIPGQSIHQWLYNLEKAISLGPTHISMYLLQLEPSTPLGQKVANKEILMLEDEIELDMYNRGCNFLVSNRFKQYEISNFSKDGYQCQQNLIYWQANRYLGFGTGAVSFIGNQRCLNKLQIVDYINYLARGERAPIEILETMNEEQLIQDAIILGLRLTEGIEIIKFNKKFNIDILSDYKIPIKNSTKQNLLKIENGFLKLTNKGYFLSNQVLWRFIGD